MNPTLKRSLDFFCTLCIVVAFSGSAAHAGIFHHKKKPLSQKEDALASLSSKQPDKELFDRAMRAEKKGKYDIARLDLQTLLNTYPESEYAMQAKLAIGDTWYKEGGAAAMQQAEEEYKDFITFFPNEPEAAEAQMKVADIYYKQMEKPDRDPTNAVRAEEEYRAMILQYPNSTLLPQAKQKLREVQEVLGQHEFNIGMFYEDRMNYGASVARLQSLIDTYPLFSHVDQALIAVGDAYSAQAGLVNRLRLPPEAKKRLENLYVQRAAAAYDRVILEYPMAPHAEEAHDRLAAMHQPIPQPTAVELAKSAALEQSRAPVNLGYRAKILLTARPSVVQAARVGEPSLASPKQIMAPELVKEAASDVNWSLKPDGKPAPITAGVSNEMRPEVAEASTTPASPPTASGTTTSATGTQATTPPPPGALEMHGVGSSGTLTGGVSSGSETGPTNAVQPLPGSPASTETKPPASAGTTPGNTNGQPAQWPSSVEDNGGLPTVAPKDNKPLPEATPAAAAPDQINDVPPSGHQVNTANENPEAKGKKHPKPKFYDDAESSSKHKKKKGLHRLNPF
jgi:outer membrane protein assembly factor BamD